ncbi:MAG TPA: ABC transporter permease subunit [Pseudobdellovibrionaceae bacterium]|jgi:ABC-type transport system involved in multi-copper enzyme maturation permease subunit
MRKVFVIAVTTLREMIRERFFLIIVFIAVAFFGVSLLLGALSFGEQQRILVNLGFTAIEVASVGISLFAGAFLISKEIEKQTLLLVLARPISRDQFLMGKISGILVLNTLLVWALGTVLYFLLGTRSDFLNFTTILFSIWFESVITLSLVIFFSIVVRPILSLMMTFGILMLGEWIPDLQFFAEKSKDHFFINAVKVVTWITPNLFRFNWKSYYFLELGFDGQDIVWMIAHSFGWALIVFVLACLLFRRKDIV